MAPVTVMFTILVNLFTFVTCNVINSRVYTVIDLTKPLARVSTSVILTNNGSQQLRHYQFVLDAKLVASARILNGDSVELPYKIINDAIYEVTLDETLQEGQQYKIITTIVYTNKIVPALEKCGFEDTQLLKYTDNLHFYSPYETELLDVKVDVENLIESTITDPTAISYRNLKPYSVEFGTFYFESELNLIIIKRLERTIDVSHYGRITITDQAYLENIGCKVTGQFRDMNRGSALYKHLPASAERIEFFDVLGKIGTWRQFDREDSLLFWFQTRYPLLGGWKTNYVIRYSVPIYEYVYVSPNDNYLLKIRGIDNVANNSFIEDLSLRILLPEGAELIDLNLPRMLKLTNLEASCESGFCISGKPTLLIQGKNLFDDYMDTSYDSVEVEYFYLTASLLRAPLALSLYLLCIFVFVMFASRLYY